MRKILIALLLILFIPSWALADTHTASSACYTDVKTAYDAASTGDTVSIPATSASDSCYADGYSDWGDSTLLITKPIKISGQGWTLTKIKGSYTGTYVQPSDSTNNGFIQVSTGNTSTEFKFELSGIEFYSNNNRTGKLLILITGAGYNWRIHHNYFNGVDKEKREIYIGPAGDATCWGLIDNNIGYFTKVRMAASLTTGHVLWQMTPQWGTDQAVFIENNVFTGENYDYENGEMIQSGNVVDGNNGARLVLRYNDCYNCNIESHGACSSSSGGRGVRSYEVYNNRLFGVMPLNSSQSHPVQNRGGSMVSANNKFIGYFNVTGAGFRVDNLRSSHASNCTTYGWCDGTSNYDGVVENAAHGGAIDGYICLGQVGAGTWSGTWGTTSTHESDPSYVWGNVSASACRGGTSVYQLCDDDGDCPGSTCGAGQAYPNRANRHSDTYDTPYQIVAGRDYFDDTVAGYPAAKPDWVAYTCPHPLADPSAQGSCDTAKYGSNLLSAENVTSEGGYVLTGGESDTTAPTFEQASLNADTLSIKLTEDVVVNTNTGFDLACSGAGDEALTFVSESAGLLTYTIDRSILQSETCTVAYTTGANYIEDAAGNDLDSFTAQSVFNQTPAEAPTKKLTISKTGTGCTITSSPSGISCGSTCEFDFTTGTQVTLGGYLENGWATITYSGGCAGGTADLTNDVANCTVTCTPVYLLN